MAVRSVNRRDNKLKRVRNMPNRIMQKQRFHQWVKNTEYIVGIDDGSNTCDKIMTRWRQRCAIKKWKFQTRMADREQHILNRVDWFISTRQGMSKNDVF